jgi:ligand-binding sensor domain-containing protein
MEDKSGVFGLVLTVVYVVMMHLRKIKLNPHQYQLKIEIPNSPVQKVFEDSHGNIWLATIGSGAIKLIRSDRPGELHSEYAQFTTTEGLTSNKITSVLEDKAGNIWLGTNGGGICCIKENPIRYYGSKEGFTALNINSICEDEQGNLWFGQPRWIDHVYT